MAQPSWTRGRGTRLEHNSDQALRRRQRADGGGVEAACGDAAREQVVQLLAEQPLLAD